MRDRIRRLERAARALEPGSTRRKRMLNAVVASMERFLRRIETAPAYADAYPAHGGSAARDGSDIVAATASFGVCGASDAVHIADRPISERGMAIGEAIELLERDVVRPGGNPASGGYLAYIPGGGVYHSALGDFIAAVTNKYAGVYFAGPGAVRLENMLVRWTADLVGYPAEAAGSLVSGGSIANLTAIAAARDAHDLRSADYGRAVVYLTSQAHHSIGKALRIAGLADARIRTIPMDDGHRMRSDALARAIREDRSAGLLPWLIIASAGTTDTGAVDPLEAIADIAGRERCWFHVDAAYGGFFLLTAHGRTLMRGIERSDSAVLDPHKGLFLPYGTGIVIVRDAAALMHTHRYTGAYMQDADEAPGDVSPADVSPELTRHFRALRMWLPLALVGTAPFAAALEEKLLLARYFRGEVERLGFETGPEPDLSVVTFRWAPRGASLDEANDRNRSIVENVRRDGRVFISSTMLDGTFVLRLAVLSFRTHLRTIDLALDVLRGQCDARS